MEYKTIEAGVNLTASLLQQTRCVSLRIRWTA
jgi:hypothetical protein